MPSKELYNLRQQRRRVCANLAKLEPMVAGYHAKLAEVEAAILAIDPQLWLPPRRYKPNLVFKRQELPRLAMTILRQAREPLPVKDIARKALAAKGVRFPDRRTMKQTRVRLQKVFWKWDARGLTVKVGTGNGTRRGLTT